MKHYNFFAGNEFDIKFLTDIDLFIEYYPDSQAVYLSESELIIFAKLLGLGKLNWVPLEDDVFEKYSDISQWLLPELDQIEMDDFYDKWIELSGREHHMNEYGRLVFLNGLTQKWNQFKFRMILVEPSANQE